MKQVLPLISEIDLATKKSLAGIYASLARIGSKTRENRDERITQHKDVNSDNHEIKISNFNFETHSTNKNEEGYET
jgi:hypothetical protein